MATLSSSTLDLQTILSHLQEVRKTGENEWKALCPAHDDHHPSLSVAQGIKGPIVHCFAGKCLQEEVWSAIVDLCAGNPTATVATSNGHRPSRKLVAVYPYTDEEGSLLYSVHRFDPKDFRQENANGEPTTRGVRRVPFHLPRLIEGVARPATIYVVEGEKDVLNLEAKGFYATCNAGGAGKWLPAFNDFLSGAHVVLIPDWDEAGKKHSLEQYVALRAKAKDLQVKRAAVGKDISDHLEAGLKIADLISVTPEELGYVPRETKGVVRLADVEEAKVGWLWENRIPLGAMTIQDGDPDQGKSLMLMEIAARISRDGVMPDGAAGVAGNVMILASEDNLNNTIKPRLRAADAVQERIYYLQDAEIPSRIQELEQLVRELEIKLLIIDPLLAYFDETVKFISEPSARKAMKPIGDMAERCNCAVVFNRHFNKDSTSGKSAMNRGSGSGAIGAQCRSSWAIGSFPNKPDERYMAHGKKNLSPIKPPTLKFHIESNSEGLPVIVWDGESEVTADQIVGAGYTQNNSEESIPEIQRAENFLKNLFTPDLQFMAANQIIDLAAEDGFSEKTLRRAKTNLNVRSERTSQTGPWNWLNPHLPL
jgi:putative DNA primase/helicase